ncbi:MULTISPECIES: hypothetical protein [Actinomadura]|uniref:Secreted protein n=1 Tax=Actinomadura yumaensis TaxID=111807 RepID=A0ABW2CJH9_9ACTN|nr:hypothetical protein [Actinomadura sp. J1-007]MWK34787.1 hypothetical protein [Actinomadura sp. J1-007]
MRPFGVLAIAAVMFAAAGCGGGDEEKSSGGAATPSAAGSAAADTPSPQPGGAGNGKAAAAKAQKQLNECLGKEGVQPPDGRRKLSAKEQAAVQKCGLAVLGALNPEVARKAEALRACAQKQGLTVPPAGQTYVPDMRDPKVAAALKKCPA